MKKPKKFINIICVNDFPYRAYEDIHEGEMVQFDLQEKFDKEDEKRGTRKRHVHTKVIPFKKRGKNEKSKKV